MMDALPRVLNAISTATVQCGPLVSLAAVLARDRSAVSGGGDGVCWRRWAHALCVMACDAEAAAAAMKAAALLAANGGVVARGAFLVAGGWHASR